MAMIDAAVGTRHELYREPRQRDAKLGHAKDRDGLRTIVESLVLATKDMEEEQQALEAEPEGVEAGDQPAPGQSRGGAHTRA